VFGEGVVGAGSAASMNVGLRGDRSSEFGAFFSPSLAGSWQIDPRLRLRASGSRAFRAPTWTERFYTDPSNVSDPTLRPERFWTGEAGFTASLPGLTLDAAGFTRVADGLIDWVRPAGSLPTVPWHATNVGTATFRGVEVRLQPRPLGGVTYSLFGSGLTIASAQGDDLDGKYALRPLTRKLGASALLPLGSAVDVSVDVVNARRARESPYTTGNVRLAAHHGALRATLDLTNLANADWLDASGLPVAGRAVYLGIGWAGERR
jgi:iron complex outermembrane receptor protein